MTIEHVNTPDLTEALIRAMDRAKDFHHVMVIFDDGDAMCCISDNDLTTEHMNFMLDHTKLWLLGVKEDH